MATINFGGTDEKVVMREEFPLEKAKEVLKDKFWIIENNEERIGTMSWNDDRYMFSSQVETCFFDNGD